MAGKSRTLTIATRQSPLALWQAEHVARQLAGRGERLNVQLLPVVTEGDRRLDQPLAEIGGKGLFLKELEQALLERRADLAVHSLKDVPMQLPPGFRLAAILKRADPSDCLVSRGYDSLVALPTGARVGTSSLRRRVQLLRQRPDLVIGDLRGNIQTRLKRLDDGDFDAIVLAGVALDRLGLHGRVRELLVPPQFVSAAGQGALAIECLEDRPELITLCRFLHHPPTASAVMAERTMTEVLGGSCRVPIGAFAHWRAGQLHLVGMVADPAGRHLLQAEHHADGYRPRLLGLRVAARLIALGAMRLLADAPRLARAQPSQ